MQGVDYQLYGVAEKPALVLEIGSRYTKCGIAGEAAPRHIVQTRFKLSSGEELSLSEFINDTTTVVHHTQQQWLEGVESFLRELYFMYLQSSPRERRVVVCEDVLCPDMFRSVLTQALFDRMQVPAVTHVYTPVMALMPLLRGTALVVDIGYSESKVIPIYEGSALTSAMKCHPLGSAIVLKHIEACLRSGDSVISLPSNINNNNSSVSKVGALSDEILEGVLSQTCIIADPDDSRKIPDILYSYTRDSSLKITADIRSNSYDVLFEGDDEGISVATLVLDALKKCPKDTRMELAHNILLIGGTVMVSGFQARLLRHLTKLVSTPDYEELRGLNGHFEITKSKFPANYLGWLGGAIVGTIDQYAQKITKDVYIRNGKHIPDWTRLSKLTLI